MKFIYLTEIISIFIIIIGLIFLFIEQIISKKNNNHPTKKNKTTMKFACLIPARDESKIIENLFKSIENQTLKPNMEDVYVIVESLEDETCNIAKKYGITVLVRTNLNLKRKGYALDEGIKQILAKKKKYDAYFIFDADNILDKNFFYEMNKSYQEGYDIVIGYRNTKNGNKNVIAAASTLTFSMINTVGNIASNKTTGNVTISGTGFFIRGEFIELWQGYPFTSLTEDYELTLYSVLNQMTSFYNTKAEFYDEQPTTFKQSFNQRVRWIKGYFEARKLYIKKLKQELVKEKLKKKKENENKTRKNYGSLFGCVLGVIPFIIIIVGLITYFILSIINMIVYPNLISKILLRLGLVILIIYIILLLFTIYMLKLEGKKLNLTKKAKIKAVLFNPIFLMTYLPCAIKALFTKEVSWVKIEHKENKILRWYHEI